jgi:hypothetical protein
MKKKLAQNVCKQSEGGERAKAARAEKLIGKIDECVGPAGKLKIKLKHAKEN